MGVKHGVKNEFGKMTACCMRRPHEAFQSQYLCDQQWGPEGLKTQPDFNEANFQHTFLSRLLKQSDVQVNFQAEQSVQAITSINVRDALIVCPEGVISCCSNLAFRKGEAVDAAEFIFQMAGGDIIGEVSGDGFAEGGDFLWLKDGVCAIGVSERTNEAGARQIEEILKEKTKTKEVVFVKLPPQTETEIEAKCRPHLSHCFSVLSPTLAIAYHPRLPAEFLAKLDSLGIDVLDMTEEDYFLGGGEVLVVKPKVCVINEGCKFVKAELEQRGWKVLTADTKHLGGAGPVALTLPYARD